jgi:hypothetical protein
VESDDRDFLVAMVEELESSMRALELDEAGMIATIGAERVLELEKFWKNELDEIDMQEIRRGLDYNDRHLIFIWNRLDRVRHYRALAGQSAMRLSVRGNIAPL